MSVSAEQPMAATTRRRRARLGGFGVIGTAAIVVIGGCVLLAIIGPWIAPHDPTMINLSNAYVGPQPGHPLGFDGQGRDLLSRLLAGARTSVIGPIVVVAISTLFGTAIAVAQSWRGGWVDGGASSVSDAMLAFPGILLALLAVAMFGSGLTPAVLALTIVYTPLVARLVRSAAVREVSLDYMDALRGQGFDGWTICRRHLLPNVMPLVVAISAINLAWATVDLAAISYLGLGVQEPTADWGRMVSTGQNGVLRGYPAESLAAGLCIIVMICAFKIVGDLYLDRSERAR